MLSGNKTVLCKSIDHLLGYNSIHQHHLISVVLLNHIRQLVRSTCAIKYCFSKKSDKRQKNAKDDKINKDRRWEEIVEN